MPDIKGFTANDYLKTDDLTKRGYAAAEAHKAELMQYSISDSDWAAYIANRNSKLQPGSDDCFAGEGEGAHTGGHGSRAYAVPTGGWQARGYRPGRNSARAGSLRWPL